jgi:hypothetical protein
MSEKKPFVEKFLLVAKWAEDFVMVAVLIAAIGMLVVWLLGTGK